MLIDGGGGAAGLFAHYPASPAAIESAAEALDATYGDLNALSTDVDVAHAAARSGVAGLLLGPMACAPLPVKDNARDVMGAAIAAAGAVRVFGEAVTTYNGQIDALNARWSSASATDFGVPPASYPPEATPQQRSKADDDRASAVSAARAALLQELRADKERCDSELDANATTAASRLDRGPTMEVIRALYAEGGLPSTTALAFPSFGLSAFTPAGLPSDLADLTPTELADYLLAHPETHPNIMLNISDEVAQIMGQKLAADVASLNEDSSREEIEHITSLLVTWQGASRRVSAQLYLALGPENALDLLDKLGANVYAHASDTGTAVVTFVARFKEGLEFSTAMWTDQQGEDYGRGLVTALSSGDLGNHRSVALSYLLHDGRYSTGFLGGVGDELDHLEREANGGRYGQWLGRSMGPNSLSAIFPESRTSSYYDPMTSLMTALANNDEAALNFFAAGDGNRAYDENATFNADEARARQEYYLQDRVFYDQFDGLLGALDAATTADVNLDGVRQHHAAGLVSSIVEYLPDRHLEAGDDMDQVSDDGTVHLAHIVSTYMESVDHSILNPEGEAERGGAFVLDENGFASPLFEQGEIKDLVKLAVSTDDGVVEMRHGVSAYQALQLQGDIAEHGELTEAALRSDARLEGWFADAVGEQQIQDAEDADKRVAAWIDMGKSLVGVIPLPGADLVGTGGAAAINFLSDVGTDAGGDFFTDRYASNEAVQWQDSTQAAERALEQRQIAIATALYEPSGEHPGLISDAELRQAAGGYSPELVERWFGTPENPRLPTPEEVSAWPQSERDQYETVLKDVLEDTSPTFATGSYQDTYKTQFQGYFDEVFDD